jgi:hypothetical protein
MGLLCRRIDAGIFYAGLTNKFGTSDGTNFTLGSPLLKTKEYHRRYRINHLKQYILQVLIKMSHQLFKK